MARVEKLVTHEAIQTELDIYNPLLPARGRVCATLFVELTTHEQMRTWLPALVGVEHSILLRAGDGTSVRCAPEAQHEAQLTRETVTAAVHYLVFAATPDEAVALGSGPVSLVCDHPAYPHEVLLPPATAADLMADLAG